jgi:hypothetical protein
MRPAWQDREDDIYLRMSGSVPDPDEAFHERMALRDEVARHAPADCSLAEIDATVRQLSGGRFFTAPPGEGLPLADDDTTPGGDRTP